MQIEFKFLSGGFDRLDWQANEPGKDAYRVSLCYGVHSAIVPEHRACVESSIGILRVHGENNRPELVEAFNMWRAAKFAADMAVVRSRPDLYGDYDEPAPTPAVFGEYNAATNLWERK